ncbi:phosphonate metabolism protein/1,5-bisphosphokinase (PRPP-forming) PhnN [Aureimonas pseudogalii]|uniref:Ribose 1,5-bisphosphate phosphokinase PhnN n=1 Tax=Aureimonas pseudogalii TaxID=1744844 RepID=A0A7W6H4Y9_9HYPH|nr:phosphonate metabolism protein/1,5-bisphosphokinase (PRPP-forming) PhnN [Aureimonas pseudogalii]MBB3998646.1 ribose 1,5-bisphosphokinase [Aureimonas pseudogalii]
MSADPRGGDGAGRLVAVVGPSGAGKDTLIAAAARHFAGDLDVRFARRIVTRPADRTAEDHDTLDEAGFENADRSGAFCLTWIAHGLRYGLPCSVETEMDEGHVVVANLSRRALPMALARFRRVDIVEVTARPDILLQRILARGRESAEVAATRLARQVPLDYPASLRIDNSGDLDAAMSHFAAFIERVRADGRRASANG